MRDEPLLVRALLVRQKVALRTRVPCVSASCEVRIPLRRGVVLVIGAVSMTLALIGLELGSRIGTHTGERSELLGGLVLIGVGIALATGVI
jgi:putative Mn2+ efflux pump MntP